MHAGKPDVARAGGRERRSGGRLVDCSGPPPFQVMRCWFVVRAPGEHGD